MPGEKVQHTDTLIQTAQKVGATVAVASTPVSFIESSIQIASLAVGVLGLIVAGFSAWVSYKRLRFQQSQIQAEQDSSI